MALIETLTDTFDGSVLDAALWMEPGGLTVSPVVGGGQVTWTRNAGEGMGVGALESVGTYVLGGSSITANLYADTGAADGAGVWIQLVDLATSVTAVEFYANYPTVGAYHFAYTTDADGAATAAPDLDPDAQWFRFRDAGSGVIHLESSPDGTTWTDAADTGTTVTGATAELTVLLGAILPSTVDNSSVLLQVGVPAGPAIPVALATGSWDTLGPPSALATASWDVLVSLIEWDGETAEATVEAGEGSFAVSAGTWFTGATAAAVITAGTGALELGAGPAVWEAMTAEAVAIANPGAFLVGTQIVGDPFALPVPLTGLGGAASALMGSATLQAGEPYTHGALRTWWFQYSASVPGTLTITSAVPSLHFIDVYDGDELADLVLVGTLDRTVTGPTSLAVEISTGTYYIRMSNSISITLPVTYSLAVTTDVLVAENRTPTLVDTPAVLSIGVLNALPDEDVLFKWWPPTSVWIPADITRPITLITVAADETGTILDAGVPVSEVGAGTHTIYISGVTSGRTDTVTVVVENSPPAPDVDPPSSPPPLVTVGRWNMHDPAAGGLGTYTFPRNPASMSSPHAPRTVLVEHTTSASGQAVLWEGGLVAHEWQFAGYVDTQEFHDKVVAFASLNRRFWLTDHRGRQWLVGLYGLDMKPVKNVDKPWAHNYSVQAHIYGQAVTATVGAGWDVDA